VLQRALLIGSLATVICAAASTAQAGQDGHACGDIHATGQAYRVNVFRGNISCDTAKSVIKYVLGHGQPSQGSPGAAPRGWSCGYGFGYVHGDSGVTEEAGPNCSRGRGNIQGTVTPQTPVDPYAAS
jgi:hypothetical protein